MVSTYIKILLLLDLLCGLIFLVLSSYKNICSQMTLKCAQEFVLEIVHSYIAIRKSTQQIEAM